MPRMPHFTTRLPQEHHALLKAVASKLKQDPDFAGVLIATLDHASVAAGTANNKTTVTPGVTYESPDPVTPSTSSLVTQMVSQAEFYAGFRGLEDRIVAVEGVLDAMRLQHGAAPEQGSLPKSTQSADQESVRNDVMQKMESQKLSQRRAASEVGIPRTTFQGFLHGRPVSDEMLKKVEDWLE